MRRLSIAALVLALFAVPSEARAQGMPSELPPKINAAIDKGVVWLKARQIKDGTEKDSWGTGTNPIYDNMAGTAHPLYIGITAFTLMTLLECDVDPEDPVIVSGLDFITRNIDNNWSVDGVGSSSIYRCQCYEAGALLMMIESLFDAKIDKQMKAAKKNPKTDKRPPIKLEAPYDTIAKGAAGWLSKVQSRNGGWRYGSPAFPSPGGIDQDTSATQITLLGLVAAVRIGIPVDTKVFHSAVITTLETQEKDGPPAKVQVPAGGGGTTTVKDDKCRGWAYTPGGPDARDSKASGGMTASGICSLIIIKSQLKGNPLFNKDLQARVDKGIFDGLAWLDANWTVESNPGGHRSHYYYLYGLERVGVLGGIETIGANGWYVQGALHLVKSQKADGKWDSGTELQPADVLDTCFALLFLKKATMPVGVVLTR